MGPSLPSAGLVRPDASRFGKDETAGPREASVGSRGFLMRDWREPRSTLQPGLHVFRYAGLLELNPPDPMQIG